MRREELENIRLPEEVINIIEEMSYGDIPEQLPIDSYWDHCQFGNYLVIPQNTAGSDDYHESRLRGRHNVRPAFTCDLGEFVATVSIYEKIDPNLPAFFVVEETHASRRINFNFPFRIVVW
jgi:hypothetical protein